MFRYRISETFQKCSIFLSQTIRKMRNHRTPSGACFVGHPVLSAQYSTQSSQIRHTKQTTTFSPSKQTNILYLTIISLEQVMFLLKTTILVDRRDPPNPGKYIIKLKLTKYSRWKLSGWLVGIDCQQRTVWSPLQAGIQESK